MVATVACVCTPLTSTHCRHHTPLHPTRPADARCSPQGQKYSEVIVFVVGGGCYAEFYNLQELLKAKAGSGALRSVVYGCSEVVSGDRFLAQLERLGAK